MVITLFKISFLARLLTPEAFGLFSLTAIALGLSEAMTQTGINITIIQSKKKVEYFLDTAWVIAIIRGFVIGIIMLLMGVIMSWIFKEPQLMALISVSALVPVIKGFINPYTVILHKEMFFFKDSIYRFSRIFVESILAILIAWMTGSVWAMIFALIGGAFFELAISFLFFKVRPHFNYLASRGRTILKNAKWLSLTTVLHYLNENADNFIVGRVFGTHLLGIYHNAYSLSHKATYDFSKSAFHSTFPIFIRIADKPKRLKRAFSKSMLGLVGFMFLVSLPLLIAPDLIVGVFLGNQWLEAIPLIRPLVFAGIIQGITHLANSLFMAKKKYKLMNIHLLTSLILMIILIVWWGAEFGLLGAVWGILVSRLLALPIVIWGVKKTQEN